MEHFLSSPLLYNLALTLIHFLWQGGLIALILKCLLLMTPYERPQLRYTWSTLAMIACLAIPIITYNNIYQPNYQHLSSAIADIAAINSTQAAVAHENIAWYQDFFITLPYVSIIWLTTVSMLASKILIELYNVNQLPKKHTIEPSQALLARFERLSQQVGLSKAPQLLISLQTDIPMAIGWLKPVILIPTSMLTGLTPSQLDMLILHELAQVRRHDYFVNFIQTLVETSLFFHPSVRWISKQMRNEREYCSDDIAVKISGNPIAYAHTLADTASICTKHRHGAIPDMAMAASGGDLKQRVVRLVNQHHCSVEDDSGKFLASVLIVISILAVAIKPLLNSDVLDLTTGRISLFQSNKEYLPTQPAKVVDLSATSIANLLLNKDQEQAQLNNEPASRLITTAKSNVQEQSNKKRDVQIAKSIAPQTALLTTKTTEQDAKELAEHKPKQTSILTEKDVANNTAVETLISDVQSKEESAAEKLAEAPIVKSQTELAFEKTDSSHQKAVMTNPYANQIANLMNEPVYTEFDNKLTNPSDILENKIAASVVKKKKPLFTINHEPKPAVVPPKPTKKSAVMLKSVDPRYPSTAKRKGIELEVFVNFTIDNEGFVKNIEFEQKNKVSYFRSSIKTALQKWRFLPAQYDGKPVESKMSKIFSFSLLK